MIDERSEFISSQSSTKKTRNIMMCDTIMFIIFYRYLTRSDSYNSCTVITYSKL